MSRRGSFSPTTFMQMGASGGRHGLFDQMGVDQNGVHKEKQGRIEAAAPNKSRLRHREGTIWQRRSGSTRLEMKQTIAPMSNIYITIGEARASQFASGMGVFIISQICQ